MWRRRRCAKGWVDAVGLGQNDIDLSRNSVGRDARTTDKSHKRVCRTFSDCTTGPRNGLPSGCYPLDGYYKKSEMAEQLKAVKAKL